MPVRTVTKVGTSGATATMDIGPDYGETAGNDNNTFTITDTAALTLVEPIANLTVVDTAALTQVDVLPDTLTITDTAALTQVDVLPDTLTVVDTIALTTVDVTPDTLTAHTAIALTQLKATFDTVGTYTFTVPTGVTTITVDCYGAQGGAGNGPTGGAGAKGGQSTCDITVSGGDTLQIRVGG